MSGLYSCSAIQNLIDKADALGYEMAPMSEGTLGYGSFVLIAPKCANPKKYYPHIVVEEVYLNEWSSAHKVRKCKKISKALETRIQKYADKVVE